MARNILKLGKIDYNNSGRKINMAQIEWDLKDGRFSMSGGVWNSRGTDYIACGQMVDEIARFFPGNKKLQRMVAIWHRYHLNDMKAGSPRQELFVAGRNSTGIRYDYAETCNALSDAGLLVDSEYLHNGEPYRYGTAWLKESIPDSVQAEIMSWSDSL